MHSCQTFSEGQYAASFQGHLGAVYRVQESPFAPDLFLTASEDWTIRLWSKSKVCVPPKSDASHDTLLREAGVPSENVLEFGSNSLARVNHSIKDWVA